MNISRVLRYTGLGLLLAVLAAGPLFRGLFFWTELLAAIAVVSLGFGLWLLGRRLGGLPTGLPGGSAGAALLTLLALYLLQFGFGAVYPRGNLDWLLRVATACFAYIMLRAEAGKGLSRWFGWIFVLSAAVVGLVGFLEYTGYLLKDPDLAKTLSLVGLNARMFTTFQYPNTAAAYFLAAMLAAAGLALEDLRAWKLTVAGGLMTFLMLAFFFTVSRGAVVVLPFGLLFLFIGLPAGRRWPALLLLLATAAPMVVAMAKVGLFSAAHNYISAFKWITAATVGGAIAGLVLAYFLKLKQRLQLALAGGALILAVAGLAVIHPAGLLPKQASRLLDMNFRTVNVVIRLRYDQDALHLIAAKPLGRGGWGWDRGYRQVQTFNYTARETHDHYAQTAVEAGIPGLLALLAALGAALWAAWRNRRENPLGWTLAAAAALIAAHSAIDFDLSYGVMWLLLWSLLAVSAAPASAPAAPPRFERIAMPAAAVVALGAAVLAGVLAVGSHYTDRAADLAAAGKNADAKVAAARLGARYDPWNSEPLRLIGDRPALERAAQLDPYNSGIRFELSIARELQRDFTGALAEAKAALADQPQVSTYYTKVASLEGNLLNDALHDGNRDEAKKLAADLVQLGADFTERKRISDPQQKLWSSSPKLEMGADFQLRYGQALYLAGNGSAAEPLLKSAAKVGLLGSEAELWLYVLYEKRGDTKAMAALADKPWIRFRNANPVYKLIREW